MKREDPFPENPCVDWSLLGLLPDSISLISLIDFPPTRFADMVSNYRLQQGGSNGFKKCDLENPKVRRNIIGQKMNFKNRQYHHID